MSVILPTYGFLPNWAKKAIAENLSNVNLEETHAYNTLKCVDGKYYFNRVQIPDEDVRKYKQESVLT